MRGSEKIGSLDLLARAGQRWTPAQLGLIRTASGALGSALGACFELRRLRSQPGRDSVTGLPDARAFRARLVEELARARRHGLPVSVVNIDLDHFGSLNEKYGREVGDEVLAETALVLKLTLRESDILARLGGDGFAVILPETDGTPARRAAERVCKALEEHRFPRVSRVSASAGVAASPRDGVEAVELLNAMDQALAIAKKSGRRRVGLSGPRHAH
jgi:diguanylate cyclase (GGDEF)-like protein